MASWHGHWARLAGLGLQLTSKPAERLEGRGSFHEPSRQVVGICALINPLRDVNSRGVAGPHHPPRASIHSPQLFTHCGQLRAYIPSPPSSPSSPFHCSRVTFHAIPCRDSCYVVDAGSPTVFCLCPLTSAADEWASRQQEEEVKTGEERSRC